MIGTFWICAQLILVGILHDGDAITGGDVAVEGLISHMAWIDNRIFRCGGAVLDEYHILTAAYCVNGFNASDITVVAGTASLGTQQQVVSMAERIYVHPNYREECSRSSLDYDVPYYRRLRVPHLRSTRSKNDIAVLRLTEPLPLGNTITSVDLPSSNSLPYDKSLLYSGWGKPDGQTEYRLRFILLTIVPRTWSSLYREFSAKLRCVQPAHADIEDIGNPLVHQIEPEANVVYGITSDAELLPQGRIIFTKVLSHLSFIQKAMSDVDNFGNC